MRNTSLMRKFWLSVGLSSLSTLGTPWGVMVGWLGTTSVTTLITTLSFTAPLQAAVLSSWEFDPSRQELEIIVPGGTTPQYSLVAEPARIIVDLPGTDLGTVPEQQTYGGAIREIRVAQFAPGLTRIVLELAPGTVLAPGHVELQRVGEGTTQDGQPGDRWVVRPLLATDTPIANTAPEPAPEAAFEPNTAVSPSPAANSSLANSDTPPVASAADTNDADELPPLEPGALEIPVQMPPEAIASSSPESGSVDSEQNLLDQTTESQVEENQTEENQAEENQAEETELPTSADGPDHDVAAEADLDTESPEVEASPVPDVARSTEADGEVEPPTDENLENSDENADENAEASEAPVAIVPDSTSVEDATPAEEPIPVTEPSHEPSAASEPTQSAPVVPASVVPAPPAPTVTAPIAAPEGVLPSLPSPGSTGSNAVTVNVPPLAVAPDNAAPDRAVPDQDEAVPEQGNPDAAPAEVEPSNIPSNGISSGDSPSESLESPSASSPSSAPFPTPSAVIPPSSEATLESNSPPIQSAPSIVATAPPATPNPTPANPVNRSIAFGQPLPGTSSHGSAATPGISLPPATHSPESVLLPSGTVLSLRYPGETPLELAEGQPRQEVLVLAEAVQDQAGNTILPEGTYVIGRFETKTEGSQFIAQAISVQGQTLLLNAQSDPISGDRESDSLLRNSALGVAAGAVLGGLTGIGLIPAIAAGAAASAATTYVTTPNPAIIQPDQVVEVQLIEDLLRINASGIGG